MGRVRRGQVVVRAVGRASLVVGLGALGLGGAVLGGPSASGATAGLGLHPNHFTAKPTSGGSSSVGWASSNWSGYAVTSPTPFTSITGNWTVPSVQPSSSATYSAAWAGIDGFNNSSLIQTGTEQDYYNGVAHYSAWWTTSAQNFAEQVINDPVIPGDHMTASITETNVATSAWVISLSDTSRNWTFVLSLTYTGPRASAEWIMEAPTVGGRLAPLANYASPTTFDPGTVNGVSPGLLASEGGELVQGRGARTQVLSIPSGPDVERDGFNISYGSVAPSAPAS